MANDYWTGPGCIRGCLMITIMQTGMDGWPLKAKSMMFALTLLHMAEHINAYGCCFVAFVAASSISQDSTLCILICMLENQIPRV